MKRFGDVPWYEKTIDPTDTESLQKPRDSRQFVVDKIIEDLDYAIENLTKKYKHTELLNTVLWL